MNFRIGSVAGMLAAGGLAAQTPELLEELVVTASGSEEALDGVAQTIFRYEGELIGETAPRQLTDFFQMRGLAQIQEFGPGHATMFLRGAATNGNGQGWNDGSEVLVLVNGRTAGTANLGKFSTHDLERVEVLHGPNSVLYGSSALGGVVNLITKDGGVFEGTELTTIFSSSDRYTQVLETGRKVGDLDYYLALSGTLAGDYRTGRGSTGEQPNTGYDQYGMDFSMGYELRDGHRLDFTLRHDALVNAGHGGATYSLTDSDDRYNTSAELLYTGEAADGRTRWTNRLYWVRDEDEFHRSQDPLVGLIPAIAAPGLIGTPGITRDFNERVLMEWGNRLAFHRDLTETNTLTAGLDLRVAEVENRRERTAAPGYLGGLIGIGLVQPPLAVDSRTTSAAIYVSESQTFFDERLRVTLGTRYDRTEEEALRTQNSPVAPSSETRDIFVHQLGVTWRAEDWLVLRASAGTGFLAANASQLFGTIQTANGYAYLPNPALKDVKSFGWDVGARAEHRGFTADVAFYENAMHDYIVPFLLPGTATLQWRNADERMVRGIQGEISQELGEFLQLGEISVMPYAGGNWFLSKKSVDLTGAAADQYALADYSLNAGVRVGQTGKWGMDLFVTASGPSEVNGGFLQNFNVPIAQIQDTQEVKGYALLNFSAHWQATENLTLFCGVNNILDKNYSPYFLAKNNGSTADVAPWLLPGVASGEGISSPGREFFGGLTFRF
jgi:vitamin B12 transporter